MQGIKSSSFLPTHVELAQEFPATMPKATDLLLFDPYKANAAVQGAIDKYKSMTKENLEMLKSQFRQFGHPALSKAIPVEQKFHQRHPELNRLPLFYSAFETEIPRVADIQNLPAGKKEAASTRLVAKRFIDSTTGKSIFADPSVGKNNPCIHMQELPLREIRGQAATSTIDKYSGKYIQDLYQHVIKSFNVSANKELPVTVYLVRPARNMYADDCTINFLSLAAQCEITESLNALAKRDGKSHLIQFSDNKNAPVLSRTARSNASPVGRLVQQGYLNTSEIKKADQIILVDDHTQAGGTLLTMATALTAAGANVLAAATVTTHPLCAQLTLAPSVEALLNDTLKAWDTEGKVQAKLAEFGLPINTLTNHEAMIVIAYAVDPDDSATKQKFLDLEQTLYGNNHVMEGENDALGPILNQKPLMPEEVVKEMDKETAQFRKVTAPTSIKDVHVLDWDNFLRDEKGMNYQLMHNTLVIAAQKYGMDYPLLADLAEAVANHRGKYLAGMPILCMSQEQFSLFTIQKDGILIKDMVADLLATMGALEPELKRRFETLTPIPPKNSEPTKQSDHLPVRIADIPKNELLKMGAHNPNLAKELKQPQLGAQKIISNILYHEFLRQYQKLIRPAVHEQLLPKETVEVPFPDVAPTLLPGAQDMLDTLRKPHNFVALISNRSDSDVRKELNKLGLMHQFDVVSGTPELTQTDEKGVTTAARRFSKPDPTWLKQMLAEHHNLDGTSWNFGGDTVKDITQALPLIRQGLISADKGRGAIVNPSVAIRERTAQEIEKDTTISEEPQIIAAQTLSDAKLKSYFNFSFG